VNRPGFTLAELLVTMVVVAILGTALARLIVSNSRFVSEHDAALEAREAARAGMHTMSSELRMVGKSGLLAASRDSVRLRVPIAFGMICRTIAATTVASMLPVDSATYTAAVPEGLAWRSAAGIYTLITRSLTVSSSANLAACAVDSIRVVPRGWLADITGIPGGQTPPPGSIFYLFQTVTYAFRPSGQLPGRIGLWRKTGSTPYEELVAPFDSSARFAFLLGPDLQLSLVPPADLNTVRGLELRLVGASDYIPQGRPAPATFDLRTRVVFMNQGS
jgi:prepilin-type N-terminal cleavage/methylation domain-containing protein